MAATIQIREYYGAGPSNTDKTGSTIRFKRADDADVNTANPMVKPSSGYQRSYIKQVRLYCSATGGSTSASNLKWYTDGSKSATGWGSAHVWYVKNVSSTLDETYETTRDQDSIGNDTGYVDAFGKTSGAPLVPAASAATSFTFSGGSPFGNYVKMYLRIDDTTTAPLTLGTEGFTFSWDEV